jgi:diacylglycerol kinase
MSSQPEAPSGRSVSRLASFGHALRGLVVFARQPNARLHLLAALGVTVLGLALGIRPSDWLALVLAMAVVLTAEALNTALELVVDLVSPQWHALARDAKDVAAAGVLISSLGAAIVGLLVFVPYVFAS